jgi:plasmid maintenance system antidote protein VapI
MTIALDNVHPSEVLLEEFLVPMGISQNRLARTLACRLAGSTRSSTATAR